MQGYNAGRLSGDIGVFVLKSAVHCMKLKCLLLLGGSVQHHESVKGRVTRRLRSYSQPSYKLAFILLL